jgi:hypothetical protein
VQEHNKLSINNTCINNSWQSVYTTTKALKSTRNKKIISPLASRYEILVIFPDHIKMLAMLCDQRLTISLHPIASHYLIASNYITLSHCIQLHHIISLHPITTHYLIASNYITLSHCIQLQHIISLHPITSHFLIASNYITLQCSCFTV